jgi:hypothetical protein
MTVGHSNQTCDACGRPITDAAAAFCSGCGSEIRGGSGEAIDRRLGELESRLAEFEDDVANVYYASTNWRWKLLNESERWSVWWGVVWRGAILWAAAWVLVAVVVLGNR